jgi:ADP-ribosyl-[dinitrogen reductase] hydrolase
MNLSDRFRGCLLGLAAGDAVGTTVEFKARGSFAPVTDLLGGGPFALSPGVWTDDTSMALCLAASLIHVGGFDPRDQMDRYCNWFEHGYLSSTGECFDIGNTVRQALRRYRETDDPFSGSTDPRSAGNGSIMRLAPVPMFYFPDHELVLQYSVESSRTTHGAPECLEACRLLGDILFRALSGQDKSEVLFSTEPGSVTSAALKNIARGDYRTRAESSIRGTGYVVDSLEAALWCFWTTETFQDAILKAANLGDDADTTAAVCGQIAGACYGASAISPRWLEKLVMREEIERMAEQLYRVQP